MRGEGADSSLCLDAPVNAVEKFMAPLLMEQGFPRFHWKSKEGRDW
jgi:hypothetical protein